MRFVDFGQVLFAVTRSFSPLFWLFRSWADGENFDGKYGCKNGCGGKKIVVFICF